MRNKTICNERLCVFCMRREAVLCVIHAAFFFFDIIYLLNIFVNHIVIEYLLRKKNKLLYEYRMDGCNGCCIGGAYNH